MQTKTEIIARAKTEILFDVADGTLPKTVANFSELHDYVDANYYGGLCDENYSNDHDLFNEIQTELSQWIIGGMK